MLPFVKCAMNLVLRYFMNPTSTGKSRGMNIFILKIKMKFTEQRQKEHS